MRILLKFLTDDYEELLSVGAGADCDGDPAREFALLLEEVIVLARRHVFREGLNAIESHKAAGAR